MRGVSAFAVGSIMMVSRLFDGISDIIMGVIVDRTKSRFGKARPWLLRMCIPFAISGILLFSVPVSWSAARQSWCMCSLHITWCQRSSIQLSTYRIPR